MLEAAVGLLAILSAKPQLTESEFTLKESISTYVELHLRAATALMTEQLKAEGLLDGDSHEPAKAGR